MPTYLPFSDNCFSAARCIRSIQHIANPIKVLAEMQRVVKPGGRLVILEPDWEQLHIEKTFYLKEYSTITNNILDVQRDRILNPSIGKQVTELANSLDLNVISITEYVRTVRDFHKACIFYSLSECAEYLVSHNSLSENEKNGWLNACHLASKNHKFFIKLTLIMTTILV
nr:methyltransferase domain-containing protein [Calothrix rhizosoleniae]